MAISGFQVNFDIWLRWVHVLAGIVWLGQLYFLDFVYLQLPRSLRTATTDVVLRNVIARTSWWQRWSAMSSVLSGLFLLIMTYLYVPGVGLGPGPLLIANGHITERFLWVFFGMVVAIVMWFNVWFVIWPAQKQILFRADVDQEALLQRRSALGVRTNTILSGAVLFAMLAPAHYGAIDAGTWLLIIAISTIAMWGLRKIAAALHPRSPYSQDDTKNGLG